MLVSARFVAILGLSACAALAQDSRPKGVHPRATPDDYAVKATGKGATYAASLVPSEQAKHLFAFDITGRYLVFEIAYFPQEGQSLQMDADDFVIKRGDKGDLTHGADATAVAAALQKENGPKQPSHIGNTQVVTEAHVGYETGRDPVTGQRVNGTYGGAGVGVEHGGPPPPDYPRPGGTLADRDLLQSQLEERQLPSGKFDHAVAGYLYFPKVAVRKDAAGNYVLEHLGGTNPAGISETVELLILAKPR